MSIFRTKDIYMQVCSQSSDLHEITDDERLALQKHLIKMYTDIEKICQKHNLTVMLAYGSALGAIRHNGFIPWDDDLDLYMPRDDYERFIYDISKELPENYIVYAPKHPNGTIANFGKVVDKSTTYVTPGSENAKHHCGAYVDIFPLDNIGNNNIATKTRRLTALAIKYITGSVRTYELSSKHYRQLMSRNAAARFNYWFRYVLGMSMSFITSQKWSSLLDKIYSANKSKTGFIHDPAGWHYDWNPLAQDIFLPPKRMKFGDISAYVPNQCEKYVERCYGNWKQIPPPEKRWRHFVVKLSLDNNNGNKPQTVQ